MAAESEDRPRVVIAGGGIAGLEALIGLHELAGERLDLTLIAPDQDFVYRPLHVEEPFTQQPAEQPELAPIARELGAEFVQRAVAGAEPGEHRLELDDGSTIDYDCAVLCVGARNKAAFERGVTFTSGRDLAHLDAVLSNLASQEEPRRI